MLSTFPSLAIDHRTRDTSNGVDAVHLKMMDLMLQYTVRSRAKLFGYDVDETETLVGENLCPTCFSFTSLQIFGIVDGAEDTERDRLSQGQNSSEAVAANDFPCHLQGLNRSADDDISSTVSQSTTSEVLAAGDAQRIQWTIPECQANAVYCTLCKHIVQEYLTYSSLQCREGFRYAETSSIEISPAQPRYYGSILDRMEYHNDEGILETDDVSRTTLIMSGITLRGPPPLNQDNSVFSTIWFQRVESDESTVDKFLLSQKQQSSSNTTCKLYWGRLRPQIAQTDLFLFWKELCLKSHNENCSAQVIEGTTVSKLRLIDVQSNCLIEQPGHVEYIALSYVWGRGNTAVLLSSNTASFYEPGYLSKISLPRTIADAIFVTSKIGEKYLWIDSLCIQQDDDQDRNYYISVMGSIYAHAKLTIVNAAGSDAQDGLPGIGETYRSPPPQPFQKADGRLVVKCLEPPGSFQALTFLGDSTWLGRGWTLQEQMLSRRNLIFTKDQVYWECRGATWREDGNWETTHPPVFREQSSLDGSLELWQDMQFESSYRRLVQHYSTRQLSIASDRIHAFDGILQSLVEFYNVDFFWALPQSYFANALAWPAYTLSTPEGNDFPISRITEVCTMVDSTSGARFKMKLPSWSWVGWKCYVPWVELSGELLDHDGLSLRVFRAVTTSTLEEITQQQLQDGEDDSIPDIEYFASARRIVSIEQVPLSRLTIDRRFITIHFWTDVVDMKLSIVSKTIDEQLVRVWLMKIPYRDVTLEIERFTHYPDQSIVTSPLQQSAILISTIQRHRQPTPSFHVMLVEWEDEIARKIGMTDVLVRDWFGLPGRQWKVVSLE